MRVLIYGAGAVGGYFGGRLVQGGAEVTFLARGAQLAALKAHGIRLESVDGDFSTPVLAVARLSEAAPPDLVLLCVKAHDTRQAVGDLARHLPPEAVVISLQNGVENPDILSKALGPERVIAATVFIGAQVPSPGVIRHTGAGFIRAGRYPQGSSEVVQRVVAFLAGRGIRITESSRIRDDMWKKLLWNAGFNGPSAIARATVGAMVARPGVRWLIRSLVEEAAAVGRACGAALGEGVVEKTCGQTDGLSDFKTSMLQDVEAGRPIENEPFYGFLVREGARLGVATPLSGMVHDTLALLYGSRA